MERDMGRMAIWATVLSLALCGCACAETAPQQIVTQSWHGLAGLYVIPTARTIGEHNLAIGYNESKHVEIFSSARFMDRQIRAPFTFGLFKRLEISAVYQSNQYDVSHQPILDNSSLTSFGAKLVLLEETKRMPAVAIAVRDIGDQDKDVAPLKNLHNGRKFFLLASKRIVDNKQTGRFVDAHLGLGQDDLSSLSPMFGAEIAVAPTASLIAEGMWDSPYVNFRGTYINPARIGTSDHQGRFIFCTGVRWYPDVVPGLVIDTGIVGDGSMEFSFGASYVFRR